MDSFTFGYWVRRQRMTLDLTQAALARRVGCARVTIKKIEGNERRPSRTMAERLAESLEVPEGKRETFILVGLGQAPLSRLPMPFGSPPPLPPRGGQGSHAQNQLAVKTGAAPIYWTVAPQPDHNLPAQLTSFIGREREIKSVCELLDANRLVTLTGHGGAGKTRLGLQAVGSALENYPDGVWLVELAALSDSELIPQQVAASMGLPETIGKPHAEVVEDYLHKRRTLLVLDNCEHLIEGCARLAERLLSTCPGLTVLATSREVLAVRGEVNFLVPPLAVPAALEQPSVVELPEVKEIIGYDAVQLFEERARTIVPDFEITPDNSQFIVEIVTRLDGIPLAIELAAARLRVLSLEQIARRLDDIFGLLVGGSRTALPRNQTLRASIDWSCALLDEAERVLLRRLSVFAGGWTLESVEQVCGDEQDTGYPRQPGKILDLLTGLVDKSLIQTVSGPDGLNRFQMLGIVRQYALEQLEAAGEAQALSDRHLAYYLQLAEACSPALQSKEQVAVLKKLERSLDNLRLSLSWALKQKQTLAMLRLVHALQRFWLTGMHVAEGIHWTREALILSGDIEEFRRSPWRAWALLSMGELFIEAMENLDEAQLMIEEAEAIFRVNGDRYGSAYALYHLTFFDIRLGRIQQERDEVTKSMLGQAVELACSVGDQWLVGKCKFRLSIIANIIGDRSTHRALIEESVNLFQKIGDGWELLNPLIWLTSIIWNEGETTRARELLEQALVDFDKPDAGNNPVRALCELVHFTVLQGDYDEARALAEKSLFIARAAKNNPELAYTLLQIGIMNYFLGELDQARAHLEESLEMGQDANDFVIINWVSEILGKVYARQGEIQRGITLIEESIAITQGNFNTDSDANKLQALGDALRLKGAIDRATDCYCKSLEIHYGIGFLAQIPPKLEALGKIAALQGREERAARLFGAAQAGREQFEIPVLPVDRAEYDDCLESLRENLGKTRLERLLAEGRAMGIEAAVACALETSYE